MSFNHKPAVSPTNVIPAEVPESQVSIHAPVVGATLLF